MVIENISKLLKRNPRITAGLLSAAMVATVSTTSYFSTLKTVEVNLDGKTQQVETHATSVKDLLTELDVKYGAHDYVSAVNGSKLSDDASIEWIPAKKITLEVNGNKQDVWTTKKTVAEVLNQEAVALKPEDKVNVATTDALTEDMTISVEEAFPIIINEAGNEKQVYTTASTVADVLTQNQVSPSEQDKVFPALEEAVPTAMTITVIKVDKQIAVTEEPIPFTSVEKQDDTLAEGTTQVANEGQDGVLQKSFEVVYENGVEVSRTQVGEAVAKEKVDKVVLIGTKKPEPVVPVNNNRSTTTQAQNNNSSTTAQAQNQTPSSKPTPQPSTLPVNDGVGSSSLIDYAKRFIGTPYAWGGTTPSGFDCSGFVGYVFKNSRGVSLPRSSSAMYASGASVSSLQPGDLVFYNTSGSGVSHVAIYIGGGQVIHSVNAGVKIDDMGSSYWASRYVGAKRF